MATVGILNLWLFCFFSTTNHIGSLFNLIDCVIVSRKMFANIFFKHKAEFLGLPSSCKPFLSKVKHTNAVMRAGQATLLLRCHSFHGPDPCTHWTFYFFNEMKMKKRFIKKICFASSQSDIVRCAGKNECIVHVHPLWVNYQSLLFIVF